jgi:hypothetical protein
MIDENSTHEKVKQIFAYFDQNPNIFVNLVQHVKAVSEVANKKPASNESMFETMMNNSWGFWNETVPAIGNIGWSLLGNNAVMVIAGLYKDYGFNRQKMTLGVLRHGFLEELSKLDAGKVLQLFDVAVTSSLVEEKDREKFSKAFALIKNFNSEELKDISNSLVDYLIVRKDPEKISQARINLIATVTSYAKTPKDLKAFEALVRTILQESSIGKAKLSPIMVDVVVKLSPAIGKALKYNKQIKQLIDAYAEYNVAPELENEFIDASKEMSLLERSNLAIMQTMKIAGLKQDKGKREILYKSIRNFMKSVAPDLAEFNFSVRNNKEELAQAIDELLKSNQGHERVKSLKRLNLKGEAIVELLEKITTSKGEQAVLGYIESPTTMNFAMVFTEANLVSWAAARAAAMVKNSVVVTKLRKAVKQVIPSPRALNLKAKSYLGM